MLRAAVLRLSGSADQEARNPVPRQEVVRTEVVLVVHHALDRYGSISEESTKLSFMFEILIAP